MGFLIVSGARLVPFGWAGGDREAPLVILSGVRGGVLVGQFVGTDQRFWEWWRGWEMRSLGDETVFGVGKVFHLVHDAVRAGVQKVSLGYLSFGFGSRVLQVSGLAGGNSVAGLVAAGVRQNM